MANNGYTEWYLQLIDYRTELPINDDTGEYTVLTANDPTPLTVYSDDRGTSLTLPATMTDGIMKFWTSDATTTLDISVLTANGFAVFAEGVAPSDHHICVNQQRLEQTLIVPYNANTACNVVVNTGFSIPQGSMIKEVFLHATTASTLGALDIGNSTDTDGYIDAGVISATGWKVYDDPIWTTGTGDSGDVISGTQIRGTLLVTFGSGSTTNAGGSGWWAPKKYKVSDATSGASLTYVLTATNSGGTGEGYIYVIYELLPTQGN